MMKKLYLALLLFSIPLLTFADACLFASPPPPEIGDGPTDLTDTRYDALRSEFLNIDPAMVSMIDIGAYNEANPGDGETLRANMYLQWREQPMDGDWYAYGVHHWCQNKYGEEVLCFRNSGGVFEDGTICGNEINPEGGGYTFEEQLQRASDPANQCNPGTDQTGSGHRFWINGWTREQYAIDPFKPPFANIDANTIPTNRFCFEFELPPNVDYRTTRSGEAIATNPQYSALVNPDVVADELKSLTINYGTYTCPRGDMAGETDGDFECGSTYHGGGSHYYHTNPAHNNRYPFDAIYAVDENTFVSCIGPHPSGVRTGMRPTFGHNPMSTIIGERNNITDAYSYHSYLTKMYVVFPSGNTVQYPNDTKINRFWFMYEPDDIMLLNCEGGVRSMDLINQGDTAEYLVHLRNKASESRDYRLFMSVGDNQQLNAASDKFKVFIDTDGDGSVTAADQELLPYSVTTLGANQEIDLILTHTPDFTNHYETTERTHGGYTGATAGLVFREVNRMRSAAFSLRTWQAQSPAEILNKHAVLQTLDSPIAESGVLGAYDRLEEFNHLRTDRPWFIRSWPDYVTFTAQ